MNADPPCGAFRSEVTGAFDMGTAVGVCTANFNELGPDQKSDNECCDRGSVRPDAASTANCIARFPAPPPTPVPSPSPAPSLDPAATAAFCTQFEENFNATYNASGGCTTCNQARVDPITGLPPSGCPRAPGENTTDQLAGGAQAIEIAVRQLAIAETLISDRPNMAMRPNTNAAIAGNGNVKPPVANPIVQLPKISNTNVNNVGGGKSGGSGGFLGGNSGGTGVLSGTEVAAISMDSAGATPGGGGGGGGEFKGRSAGTDGDDGNGGAPDGENGKVESFLFKGARELSSQMETPEDYWNRIAKGLSIFEVVTRGYRRETGRWMRSSLANVRALQSPAKRVIERTVASPPKSVRPVIKGSKRR
jgi:hypothetical protein